MYNQSEIRDSAYDLAKSARKFLNSAGHEAYQAAKVVGKRFHKVYPLVVNNVQDEAHTVAKLLRKNLHKTYPIVVDNLKDTKGKALKLAAVSAATSRRKFGDIGVRVGRDLHFVESVLIHVGLGYLALRIYHAFSKGENSTVEKVKAHIHKKPAESALIALGVGLIIGGIFR